MDFNICIEYDGEQHYRAYSIFGGEEKLKRKLLDEIKNDFCIKNEIKLIRIKYDEIIEEKLKFLWD